MKRRKACKDCGKNLSERNKSGYCSHHQRIHSGSMKRANKKYREKTNNVRGRNYNKAYAILRIRHLKEFKEIYNELMEKEK